MIGLYIGKTGVASGFGAAGSIAVVFVWVYYSAQIFLLGAEFTWIYAQMFGSRRHALDAAQASQAPPRSAGPDAADAASLDGRAPSSLAARVPDLAAAASAEHETAPTPAPRAGGVPKLGDPQLDNSQLAKWALSMGVALLLPHVVPKLLTKVAGGAFKQAFAPRRKKRTSVSRA